MDNKDKHCVFMVDHHLKFKAKGKDIRATVMGGSSACNRVAKQLHTTVLLLAQQLRPDKRRGNKEESDVMPNKFLIQESSSVEQDSDNIVCLFRPVLHQQLETIPDTHSMLGIIDKRRFGAPHTMEFAVTPKYGLTENLHQVSTDFNPSTEILPF
jgi:replicative DNA helicase